eukprot:1416372-Pyramimonas_sp.AAC.1
MGTAVLEVECGAVISLGSPAGSGGKFGDCRWEVLNSSSPPSAHWEVKDSSCKRDVEPLTTFDL